MTNTFVSETVKLSELAAGDLFTYNGTVALKTNETTPVGRIMAFEIGTGERFLPYKGKAEDLANLEVIRMSIAEIAEYFLTSTEVR